MHLQATILIVLVGSTSAVTALEIPQSGDQRRVDQLIRRLGVTARWRRDLSRDALFAIGGSALKQLRAAARDHRNEAVREQAQELIFRIVNSQIPSLGTTFAHVKPGAFLMGSPNEEKKRRPDELQHRVRLTHPFMIATREITQDEFEEVMQRQPSWFTPTGKANRAISGLAATGHFPVETVSWFDAIEFCNRLSKLDGRPAYYAIRQIERKDESIIAADVEIVGGTGYRLPTEAEWEYACRAGTTTPFHFPKVAGAGNFQHSVSAGSYGQGWHTMHRTTAVAKYKANALGLFDMHGNVAEWCWDWYDKDYYTKSPAADPLGPPHGTHRVLRGGTFLLHQNGCRSASRFWAVPGELKSHIGFRIARNASPVKVKDDDQRQQSSTRPARKTEPKTTSKEEDQADERVRIAVLIERLGNASEETRDAAESELEELGSRAIEQLNKAIRTTRDAEIRKRAHRLVRKIMFPDVTIEEGFALVIPGEFRMGSPQTEKGRARDELQHTVRIVRPFLIGRREVTQDEFAEQMLARPSWFSKKGGGERHVKKKETGDFPVDSVTWFDAILYCNELSHDRGLPPYYSITRMKRNGSTIVRANVKRIGGTGYRLPTEAEWEYACRAGTTTTHNFGTPAAKNRKRHPGNFQYSVMSRGYGMGTHIPSGTKKAGTFAPNAWGLHDMHGNVAEWCWDWYNSSYYGESPEDDPIGPAGGDHRVLRGGSFLTMQRKCRSATRLWYKPGETKYYIGFRIARNAPPKEEQR